MHTTISKQTKAELLAALRARYHRAPKADKTKVLDEFVAGCHAFAAHQRHNRGRTNLWGRESMLLQPMKAIVARMLSRPGISGLTSQLYEWPRKHGTPRYGADR